MILCHSATVAGSAPASDCPAAYLSLIMSHGPWGAEGAASQAKPANSAKPVPGLSPGLRALRVSAESVPLPIDSHDGRPFNLNLSFCFSGAGPRFFCSESECSSSEHLNENKKKPFKALSACH